MPARYLELGDHITVEKFGGRYGRKMLITCQLVRPGAEGHSSNIKDGHLWEQQNW